MLKFQSLFSDLYQYSLSKATHPHAVGWLAFLTMLEAVIFPIPTDVMLIPMILAAPAKTWRFASIAVVSSTIGAIIGYWLGVFAFEWLLQDFFAAMGYMAHFETVSGWFNEHGVICLLIGSITPIPFKVFTVAAGIAYMPLMPFIVTCLIGRAIRYYGVAAVAYFGKNHIDTLIIRYMDRAGWFVLAGILLIYWLWR